MNCDHEKAPQGYVCEQEKAQSKARDAALGAWETAASSFGGWEPRLGLRWASWGTSPQAIKKAKTHGDKLRVSVGLYCHGRGHLKHSYTHLPIPYMQHNSYFNFSSFLQIFTPTQTQACQHYNNQSTYTILCPLFSHAFNCYTLFLLVTRFSNLCFLHESEYFIGWSVPPFRGPSPYVG